MTDADAGTEPEVAPPKSRVWRWVAVILAGFLVAGALYFVRTRSPAEGGPFPPCVFHRITGLHCPGCGGTRLAHHLMNGRVGTAFRYNPLTFLLLPFLAYGIISEARRFITNKGLPYARLSPKIIWCLFGILVAFWVLRNIPVYPLTLLTPP